MSANGQLVFTDVDKVTFKGVGNTSNAVIDTLTGKIGVGIDSPSANLHVVGNCYVSTNFELGGTMTMGTVTVEAQHELSAITATGNVTPHTIQFTNPETAFTTTGNVEVGKELTVTGNVAVDTDTLFVDSVNDRVGVGKTDPATALDVVGTVTATAFAGNASTASALAASVNIGGVAFDGSAAIVPTTFGAATFSGDVAFDTNTLFVDSTNNRVGVGTTSPSNSLHVYKAAAEATSGLLIEKASGGLGTAASLLFSTNAVGENPGVAKAGIFFERTATNGRGDIQFCVDNVDNATGIGVSNSKMTVRGDGNVGIGTTNPDGRLHVLATNSNFTGFTYQTGDVKTVMANTGDGGTNISILQVYKSVQNRVPSAIDYHSETATASNVYTYCVNPYGGCIGLGTDNPNSDLTMGARIYNTTGFVGLTGTPSKGDPSNTTTTLPYTQYSTTNPATGAAYYFINPYPGEAQCTIVYDNAQTSANGLIYFYQNGPGYQPSTTLPNSTVGTSEFTIPLLETGSIRINAIHMKPVNGCQIRITAVYWVPFRGVTANIREGGKLVLGTVGGLGTPQGSLSFRPEYEQPTGNQLEPKEKVENGLAWMTDLSTWYNAGLGGNGINWSKGNGTYGVSTGARIWFQPGSFTSVSSGAPGNHGRLNLSAGYSTGTSNTPDITITSNKRVGIKTISPATELHVYGSGTRTGGFDVYGSYCQVGSNGSVWRNYTENGGRGAGIHITDVAIFPGDRNGGIDTAGEIKLGSGTYRWGQIYSTNSSISTSDRNTKQDINDITESERKVATKITDLFKTFRFKDDVSKKGDDARLHNGVIAQDLIEAFKSEGLDAHRYGLFCYDEKWTVDGEHELTETVYEKDGISEYMNEAGEVVKYTVEDEGVKTVKRGLGIIVEKDRPGAVFHSGFYSIRYEELLCFVVAGELQNERLKYTALEARILALENA